MTQINKETFDKLASNHKHVIKGQPSNWNSISRNFSVSQEEQIWGYVNITHGILSLTYETVIVFTDKGIHFSKAQKYINQTNSTIIWNDIIKYYIYDVSRLRFGDCNSESFVSIEMTHIKDIATQKMIDVAKFCGEIQAIIAENNPEYKKYCEDICESLWRRAKAFISSSEYGGDKYANHDILMILIDQEQWTDTAVSILAYRAIYLHSIKDFMKIWKKYEESGCKKKAQVRETLINMIDEEFEAYAKRGNERFIWTVIKNNKNIEYHVNEIELKEIKDLELVNYFKERLLEGGKVAKEANERTRVEKLHVFEKASKKSDFDIGELDNIANQLFPNDSKKAEEYLAEKIKKHNQEMSVLLEEIIHKTNNYVDDTFYQSVKDSIGFGLVHYFLMNKQYENVSNRLSNITETGDSLWVFSDDVFNITNYSFLAYFMGNTDLADKLLELDPTIVSLKKSIKSLKNIIAFNKARYGVESAVLTTARNFKNSYTPKNEDERNRFEDFSDKYEAAYEDHKGLNVSIEELQNDLEGLEKEIEIEKSLLKKSLEASVEYYNSSGDLLVKKILSFYRSPSLLLSWLEVGDGSLYRIQDNWFFVPWFSRNDGWTSYGTGSDAQEQQRENQSQNKEQSKEPKAGRKSSQKVAKPYGDKWFSDEARFDYALFKKEYHELAKKFHPDVDRSYANLFVEIQIERAGILEGFASEG